MFIKMIGNRDGIELQQWYNCHNGYDNIMDICGQNFLVVFCFFLNSRFSTHIVNLSKT